MTISLNTKKRRKSRSAKSSTPGDPGISLFVFSHRTKSTNSLISPSDQELRSRVENNTPRLSVAHVIQREHFLGPLLELYSTSK